MTRNKYEAFTTTKDGTSGQWHVVLVTDRDDITKRTSTIVCDVLVEDYQEGRRIATVIEAALNEAIMAEAGAA